jgi:hypothetical protein
MTVANIEINKFEEEINAVCNKAITPVSTFVFKERVHLNSDNGRRKITRNSSEARGKSKISYKHDRKINFCSVRKRPADANLCIYVVGLCYFSAYELDSLKMCKFF